MTFWQSRAEARWFDFRAHIPNHDPFPCWSWPILFLLEIFSWLLISTLQRWADWATEVIRTGWHMSFSSWDSIGTVHVFLWATHCSAGLASYGRSVCFKKSKLEQSPPLGKKVSPTMFLWSCDLTPRAKLQWVKKWLQACVVCRVTNHSGLPRIKKFFSNTGLSALQLGHFLANYFDLVTLEMGQTGRVWKLGHES